MKRASASTPGVICAGSIVLDTIVRPVDDLRWGTTTFVDSIERHLGGNCANTGRALTILGASVRLLGAVGNDDAGSFALTELRRSNLDTQSVKIEAEPNAATVVLVDGAGDRQFLHRLGASNVAFRDVPEFTGKLTSGIQHFHLASLFVLPHLRANAPEILRRARSAGLTTSLDTNWDPRNEWLNVVAPCLPYTDVLFLNEDESRMITGDEDPVRAARFLQEQGVRIVVQKRSRLGCIVCEKGDEIRCAPYAVNVVDSTGAGDCFAAGFLLAWLRGESLSIAGEYGNAAGALSVSSAGAITGLLAEPEFTEWKRNAERPPTEAQ